MRRSIVIITVLFLLAGSASAIQKVPRGPEFGVKFGIAMAENYGSGDSIDEVKTGVAGGVFVGFEKSPSFSIQPEVLFVQKGWKIFGNKVNLDYIEIPMLAKFKFPTEGSFAPNLFAGPVGSFLVSADVEGEDISELFKDFDFGFALGAGADIGLGRSKVVIDARYTLGLTSFVSDHPDWHEDADSKNSAITFMVGVVW